MKKIWSTTIWCSRRAIDTDRLTVELWCLSTMTLLRVFDLVLCKILFGNKYYILWHWLFYIHFLWYVCKFDSWPQPTTAWCWTYTLVKGPSMSVWSEVKGGLPSLCVQWWAPRCGRGHRRHPHPCTWARTWRFRWPCAKNDIAMTF
jgi:hypothetical protein